MLFKDEKASHLINTLEQLEKHLKEMQREFKQKISNKLPQKEKTVILNDRLRKCSKAYYRYLKHLDDVCGVYLSNIYEEDKYFRSCVEAAVMTTKVNYIIKEKYHNIWQVKCDLLGELQIDTINPDVMAMLIKDIFGNYTPVKLGNMIINTGMTDHEFYNRFGTRMLYIIGRELDTFYYRAIHVYKMGYKWTTKEKRDIRYIISVFKTCDGTLELRNKAAVNRWIRKVNRALGLYQKYVFSFSF